MGWRTFQVCLFLYAEGRKCLHYAEKSDKIEKIYKFMREEYGFFCGFLLKLEEGTDFAKLQCLQNDRKKDGCSRYSL